MEINAYLKRIHYQGGLSPTLQNLKELQKSHLYHIPFENLDIHLGNRIILDLDRIYDKIMNRQRGGFCYELNGLFNVLLMNLGYQTTMVSAQVWNNNRGFGDNYDHLALIVHFGEKKYLADVGFGRFTFHPLEILMDKSQKDHDTTFILRLKENWITVYLIKSELEEPVYRFRLKAETYEAFIPRCNYQQDDPNSHFRQGRVISKPIPGGRVSLSETQLKVTKKENETIIAVDTSNTFEQLLLKYFNIKT